MSIWSKSLRTSMMLLPHYEIIVGGYNTFKTELHSPFGEFTELDICVVALDWRTLVPQIDSFAFGDSPNNIIESFNDASKELSGLFKDFRSVCKARILRILANK